MAEEKTVEERQAEMKLKLAEALMKTIPPIPDSFATLKPEEQDRLMAAIDSRTEKIMPLLGAKTTRGPTRNPRGPRRSERFNTPELDVGIAKKKTKE
jgi:hypothetical protein